MFYNVELGLTSLQCMNFNQTFSFYLFNSFFQSISKCLFLCHFVTTIFIQSLDIIDSSESSEFLHLRQMKKINQTTILSEPLDAKPENETCNSSYSTYTTLIIIFLAYVYAASSLAPLCWYLCCALHLSPTNHPKWKYNAILESIC